MKIQLNTSIRFIILFISLAFLNKGLRAQCSIKVGSQDSILVCGGTTNLYLQADWQQVLSIPMQKLRSISQIQKDIHFVGADSGKVYKTINGGNSFFQINSPNTNGSIRDIWFFNQQSGLVFTDSAKIFKTTNGGNNWQEINYPLTVPDSNYTWTQRVFNSVTFITENIGFVGGLIYSPSGIQGAICYKTTNAGNTWTPVALPSIKGIDKVYFTDTATGFICSNGSILKTSNGGQTWVSIFNLQYASMKDICFINKDTGFAASNGILRTFDGGTTWTTINAPLLFARGIKTDQTNSLYVFYSRDIYKSMDLGNTWIKLNINASLGQYSHYIEAISFNHLHPGIAVGFNNNLNSGFVLKMDQIDYVRWVADNGLVDTLSINPKVRPNFSTTYFVTAWIGACSTFSDVTVMVNPININMKPFHTVSCGDSLPLLPTTNIKDESLYSYQWQPNTYLIGSNQIKPTAIIKSNTQYKLTISSNNGCIDTAKTEVNLNFSLKAGGDFNLTCGTQKDLAVNPAGWSKQSITLEPPIIANLNEIVYAGSDTLYLLGGRKIWQSDKNGKSWRPVYNISGLNAGLWVNRAYFTTPQIGFVSAFDDGLMQGAILKTTNGGNTWQTVNVGNFQLGGIYFTNNQTGYVAASPSKILKTTNAGNNWLAVNVPTTNGLSEIFFPSNNIGYASGNNGTVIKSTNAGLSWVNLNTPITWHIRALHFTSNDTGFVGTNDTIWKTTNGGTSWIPYSLKTEYFKSFYITDFTFVNAQHGYASAELNNMSPTYEGGAIFETKNGGLTWERMHADSSQKLKSIFANSQGIGIAIGGNNHFIYKDIEPQNYLWSPSIGLNNPNLMSPIANPTQTTLYTVKANINDCFATDSILVTVSKFMHPSNKKVDIICGDSFTFSRPNVHLNINASQHLSSWEIRNAQNIVVLSSTPNVRTYGNFEITPGNYTFICRPKVIPPPLEIKIIPIIGDTINETINWTFDTIIIRNFAVGSTQNYTYKWLPKQEIVGPNTPEKDYTLSIIAPNGCSGNDSVTIIPKPFKIKVNGYTYGAIIGPVNCGSEIQIDSTLTNYTGKGKLIFKWSDPKLIHDTNSYYPRISPVKNGFISLQAFTQNGCTASDSIQFKVEPIFLKIIDTAVSCKTVFKPSIMSNYNGKHPMIGTWFPNIDLDSSNVYRPTFTANINRDYIFQFSTQIGCNATDTFSLQLSKSKASPICLVNVNSDNKNEIIIDKTEGLNVEKFLLWKEGNISNNYYLLGEIPYNQPYLFTDTASNPLVQSNKYTIEKIDVCGITSERSEPHKTMHLTINKGAGNTWNLIWEKYEGFTVSTYNVYRGTSPTNLQQIGTSSGANSSYSDINPPAGDVFYMVEIISPKNCSPSKTYNKSQSNIMSNKYLSVGKQEGIGNVLIYPNPTTSDLNIQLEGKSANHKLQLYTLMGQLLFDKETEEIQSSISMAEYPTGTYILIISNANGKVQRLVVKH